MSAEPFIRDPLPGLRLDGVTISEAIRLQGEARTYADEDDLRLRVEPAEDVPLGGPSHTAWITLVAVGLIAALGVAAYSQVSRQMQAAQQDAAPPPVEAAPTLPPAPTGTVAPIPAEAPQITPAAKDAPKDAGDPAAADAPVQSDVAETAETPPEKASDAAPPTTAKTVDAEPSKPAAPKVAAKPVKSAEATAKAQKADEAPVKKTAAKTPDAKTAATKASDGKATEAKTAEAKAAPEDIAHLRGQLNHAVADAQKAGVPKSVLKARQAEWKVLYVKAQHKSPAAVAALYKTRTTQLEALAKKHHPTPR